MEKINKESFNKFMEEGRTDFSHCHIDGLDLEGKRVSNLKFNHAKLEDANFNDARIGDCTFHWAELNRCDFKKATIVSTTFNSATFKEADFGDATLRNSRFECAYLSHVSYIGADLKDTNFVCAFISHSDFTRAKTKRCYWAFAHTSKNRGQKFIHFQAKDEEPAIYQDGFIRIACQNHSVRKWIKDYVEIGKGNGWAQDSIELYGDFFRSMDKLWKDERTKIKPVNYTFTQDDLAHLYYQADNHLGLHEFIDYVKKYTRDQLDEEEVKAEELVSADTVEGAKSDG